MSLKEKFPRPITFEADGTDADNLIPVPVLAEPEICREIGAKGDSEARESTSPIGNFRSDSRGGDQSTFENFSVPATSPEKVMTSGKGPGGSPQDQIDPTPFSNDRLVNNLASFEYDPPKHAKDFRVTLVDNKLAGRLNKKWHSRVPEITWGGTACNPCFAVVHKNVVYAVALWSCPIAGNRIVDGFRCLELRRMAIAPDAPKNTASRFLSIMVKMIRKTRPDVIKLISYQDTAVHKGTIYKASGWTLERQTEFVSWGITGRKGHGKLDYQAPSPKNRWALIIREKSESDDLIKPTETQDSLF